jgi:hypothetical protein
MSDHTVSLLATAVERLSGIVADSNYNYSRAERAQERLSSIYDALGVDVGSPMERQRDALAEIAHLKSAATPVLGTNEQAQAIRQATLREVAEALRESSGILREHFRTGTNAGLVLTIAGWDGTFPGESTHVGIGLATGATVLCHEDAEGRVRVEPAIQHAPDCRDTLCGGCREVPAPDAYDIGGAWEQALAEASTGHFGAVAVECGDEMLLWSPASWHRFVRDVSGWCIQDECGLAATPRAAVIAMLKEEDRCRLASTSPTC